MLFQRFGKTAYLLVGCRGDNTVYVLDGASGKQLKAIKVKAAGLLTLDGPPGATEPHVYYTTAGENGRDSGVGRIDLRTMADDGEVVLPDQSSFRIFPGIGGLLYGSRKGTSPSGVFAFEVPARSRRRGPIRARQLFYDHDGVPSYVPDLAGRFVAAGKHVVSADIRDSVAELPGTAVRFMETRPVLLCVDRSSKPNLIAISTNTFKEVGRAPSRRGSHPRGRAAKVVVVGERGVPSSIRRQQARGTFVDEKNNAALVFPDYDWQAVLVPMAPMSLPDEPYLTVSRAAAPPAPPLTAGAGGGRARAGRPGRKAAPEVRPQGHDPQRAHAPLDPRRRQRHP